MQIKETSLEQLMPVIREALSGGRNVRFSPLGVSMLPMLRQGRDSVVLSPLPGRLKKYDLPMYRRDDGQYVIHRVIQAGETYTCMGDNQFMPESGLRQDQMIGLVTAFMRDQRAISVRNPAYIAYCRVWHWSRPLRRVWRAALRRVKRWIRREKCVR